jgi:hypothetical protein
VADFQIRVAELGHERRRRLGALNHDQIIILAFEAGRGKVRGAGAQQLAVDLVILALEVQQILSLAEAGRDG